jgi:hypothetical protein
MIVVVGRPGLGPPGQSGEQRLAGLAALVATAAAGAGTRVELVGSIGDDPAGDRVAVELGRAGVGHAALLRDPAGTTRAPDASGPPPRLDAGDLELGLRYIPECRVLVVAEALPPDVAEVAADAAGYHGAAVVAVAEPGAPVPAAWERGATVLAAPAVEGDEGDPDDAARFAAVLAGFAVALERGMPPAEALGRAASGAGWERTATE